MRYSHVARILTGEMSASIDDGIRWLEELTQELSIPGLATYGMQEKDIPVVIEKARKSSSMKGNPITLTDEEMREILYEAL